MSALDSRHKLDDKDLEILDSCKTQISIHVKHLQDRGVRNANIEIELMWHIKKILKGE